MPIISISYQPNSDSLNAAYRPIVFRCKAQIPNASANNYAPPVVYCDIYVGGTYYKSISRSQWINNQNLTPEYEFDIQDAIQEIMGYNLPKINGQVVEEFSQTIKTVFVKFRNALIDANGFTKSEQLAPIQGTSTSLPVAGNGTQSNSIFVLNSTIQHEENQELKKVLENHKTGSWLNNVFPMTKRPKTFKVCNNDSSHFPLLSSVFPKKLCLNLKKKNGSFETVCTEKITYCPTLENFKVDVESNEEEGNNTFSIYWTIPNPLNGVTQIRIFNQDATDPDNGWEYMNYDIDHPQPVVIVKNIINPWNFKFLLMGVCVNKDFNTLPGLSVQPNYDPIIPCINPKLISASQTSSESILFEWDNNGYNYGQGTALLQISTDDGATWITIGTVNPSAGQFDQYSSILDDLENNQEIKVRVQLHGNGCSNMSSNEIVIVWGRMGLPIYGFYEINPTNIISADGIKPIQSYWSGNSYSICVTGTQFTRNLKINIPYIIPGQTRLFLNDGVTACIPGQMASLDSPGSEPTHYNDYGIRWVRFAGYDANGIHLGSKIFDVDPSTGMITGESTQFSC